MMSMMTRSSLHPCPERNNDDELPNWNSVAPLRNRRNKAAAESDSRSHNSESNRAAISWWTTSAPQITTKILRTAWALFRPVIGTSHRVQQVDIIAWCRSRTQSGEGRHPQAQICTLNTHRVSLTRLRLGPRVIKTLGRAINRLSRILELVVIHS